ncbi:hypothetical protein Syun_009120 [Stephania yunnanensis]|uniref:Uncharacterized protein n=1 Tax=Stephania yunnanensis TaxID=152371 RepID=A0AAP0KDV5_9MAGN
MPIGKKYSQIKKRKTSNFLQISVHKQNPNMPTSIKNQTSAFITKSTKRTSRTSKPNPQITKHETESIPQIT